ncbi:MAG: flippase-like domain-containing protein [Methanotrichaceae archaeon]
MTLNLKVGRLRQVLIAVIISIAAIIVILKFTNTSITYHALSRADIRFVLLALFLHVFSWVFWSLRIQILAALAGHNISFGLAFRTTLASNFLAAMTPSSAGGEPLRIKMLADDGMSYGSATAVVIVERLLDSFFFVAALAVCLFLSDFITGFGLKIGGVFLVLLVLEIVFLWELIKRPDRIERLMGWIRRKAGSRKIVDRAESELWLFREASIRLAYESQKAIPVMIMVTIVLWICEFLVPSVLLVSLGQSPDFLYSITAQIILVIITLAPLTPGSSGVVEFSMSYIYSMFVPSYLIGVLVALWRLITYFVNLVVGAAFIGVSLNYKAKKS